MGSKQGSVNNKIIDIASVAVLQNNVSLGILNPGFYRVGLQLFSYDGSILSCVTSPNFQDSATFDAWKAAGNTTGGTASNPVPVWIGGALYTHDGAVLVGLPPTGRPASGIVTTTFCRTDNTVASTIPVSITVDGVTTAGNITKNAVGEVLACIAPAASANCQMLFTRSNSAVDTNRTKTQTRKVQIIGSWVTQTRTVYRNSSNEILQITAWA